MDKLKEPKAPTAMETPNNELSSAKKGSTSDDVKSSSKETKVGKALNDENESQVLTFSSSGSLGGSSGSGSESPSHAQQRLSQVKTTSFPGTSDTSDSENNTKAATTEEAKGGELAKQPTLTEKSPTVKNPTAALNTKSAEAGNQAQSNVKIKILDLEKWHITYVRTRNNSLRCFPACRPKHRDRSFCGLPVFVSVNIETESKAKQLVVLGSFRKVKNDAIQLGDRFSTVELTRVLGKDFVISTLASYDKKTKTAKFKLGPPRKWRYSANTLSSTEMHAFTIYAFSKAGGSCVARQDSPLFTIVPAWRQSASEITARAQASSDEAKSGSEQRRLKNEYPARDRRMPPPHPAMYGGHDAIRPYPMYGGHPLPWSSDAEGSSNLRKRPRMAVGQSNHQFPMPRAPPYYDPRQMDPRQMDHGSFNQPRPRLPNPYSKKGSSSSPSHEESQSRYDWGAERGMPPHYNHFHPWNSGHYVPSYPPFYPYQGFHEPPPLDSAREAYIREAGNADMPPSRSAPQSPNSKKKRSPKKRDAARSSLQQPFMHPPPYYPPPGAYPAEMPPFDQARYDARFRNGNR